MFTLYFTIRVFFPSPMTLWSAIVRNTWDCCAVSTFAFMGMILESGRVARLGRTDILGSWLEPLLFASPPVIVWSGEHQGVVKSFLSLVQTVTEFCDPVILLLMWVWQSLVFQTGTAKNVTSNPYQSSPTLVWHHGHPSSCFNSSSAVGLHKATSNLGSRLCHTFNLSWYWGTIKYVYIGWILF